MAGARAQRATNACVEDATERDVSDEMERVLAGDDVIRARLRGAGVDGARGDGAANDDDDDDVVEEGDVDAARLRAGVVMEHDDVDDADVLELAVAVLLTNGTRTRTI